MRSGRSRIAVTGGQRRQRRGAIAIELGLLLSLILGTALLITEGLGLVARATFASAAGGAAEMALTTTNRADLPAAEPVIATEVRMGVLALMCSLGTLCWYALYRRRAQEQRARRSLTTADDAVQLDRSAIFDKRHEILRILAADTETLFEAGMQVRHVMSVHVTSVEPATPAATVQGLLREHDIRHLLVCEHGGKLIGIISDRDLRKPGKTARELMTASPITTEPSAPISPAITQMIQRRISCLPVIHNDRLVGVLTSTDLMLALQCTTQVLQKVAAEVSSARSAAPQSRPTPTEELELVAG
jgi:acetoin utilization protein AcuB